MRKCEAYAITKPQYELQRFTQCWKVGAIKKSRGILHDSPGFSPHDIGQLHFEPINFSDYSLTVNQRYPFAGIVT